VQIDANGGGAAHMRVTAQGHTEGGAGWVHVLFVFDFLQAAQLAPFYGEVQRIVFALVVLLWHFSTLGWCSGDDMRTSHYDASVRAQPRAELVIPPGVVVRIMLYARTSEDLRLPRHGAGLAGPGSPICRRGIKRVAHGPAERLGRRG